MATTTVGGCTLRTVTSLEELEGPWLDLVHAVFGPLGCPRAYFGRHWSSDVKVSQSLSHIFVAVDTDTNTFVATVRIFARSASFNGQAEVSVGGMGEVCTLKAYRKRGLATALLKMAMHQMARDGTQVSALHAASAAAAIYKRLGWHPAPMHIYRCIVPPHPAATVGGAGAPDAPQHPSSSSSSSSTREIDFEDDAAWVSKTKKQNTHEHYPIGIE